MVKPICAACKSDEIRKDAYAVWDVEKQEWVLHSVYDSTICECCGTECTVEIEQC